MRRHRSLLLLALPALLAAAHAEAQSDGGVTSAPAVMAAPDGSEALASTIKTQTPIPPRPVIQANRWAEDWSVLADPRVPRTVLDIGKYIPLSSDNPQTYLSLGGSLRERWETNSTPGFGTPGKRRESALLQRLELHADLHLNANWRAFVQLEDARAPGKRDIGPTDQNPLDLRLAFAEYSGHLGGATVKARVGRQDFQFDLQRFISSRDGPNVRQSFDALWADWEKGPWRVIGLLSQPVQYRDQRAFDDYSNSHLRFSMLRVERHVFGRNELSAYYALYEHDAAHFLDATGDETRHVLDARFAGAGAGMDWDVEAMGQAGSVGHSSIRAWALGSRLGYSFAERAWKPRLGLQFDMASGDRKPGDGTIGTFNPLFPNGYYFTLAGYTGFANLIHVKPSLTVSPLPALKLALATGLQWRMTTADAVYVQPAQAVPNTAGRGGAWSGVYVQMRADYAFTSRLAGALELVRYQIGDTLRQAGGTDSTYAGLELKFSW